MTMNALTAQQAGWKDTRIGRFTASTFGQLMTEPRSKAEREAGAWGKTAQGLITAKAIERLTGKWMNDVDTQPMRRGLLLEPAALYLLSKHWRTVEGVTWQAWGDNFGSTPDALVDRGAATMDIKCPGNAADVVRFADEVVDGDFDSLLAWDKGYAWQIMCQALTCGVKDCWLVYFTDRLPIHVLTNDERQEVQTLIDLRAEQHSQESFFPWRYDFASEGYFYAAKMFTLTDEIEGRIISTLARAEAECVATVERLKPLLKP
jgi:hypothetical protein